MSLDALVAADVTHTNGHVDEATKRLQIIDDEKHFNPDLSKQIERWGLRGAGFDYNIVAVFGSQSTGKSTLLNALFGTDFDVMDESKRQQTTKGIWMCQGKGTNILVMDLEGTDGRERGEDKEFERKSAVFSLASSEILIINMWEYQIGWYNGANMSLLKTVFEVNLDLFGKTNSRGRTLLLFVIRDHYGGTPLTNLRTTLISDLSRIWDDLSKPPELENRLLLDYFDLEFTTLPHKILVPEKFNAEIQSLRNRFVDKDDSNYLFKDAYCKRVPADGVAFYMEGIWERVQSTRDLDLPTQQELLAHFRCDEISAVVLAEFNGQVRAQRRPIEDGQVVEGLGDRMKFWKEQALLQYDREGSRYHQGVYARKRGDLDAALILALSPLFLGQIRNLRRTCLVRFKDALRDRLQGTDYDFGAVVAVERTTCEGDFERGAERILIEGADWAWRNELDSLRTEVGGVVDRCRKDERGKVLHQAKRNVKRLISEPVKLQLDEGSNNMWDNILSVLKTALENAERAYLAKVRDFSSDEENESSLDSLRKDSWQVLRAKIDEETIDAVFLSKLRRHFEGQFRYDKQGVPRVWEPEDDIEEAFKAAKIQTLDFIPLYAEIRPQDFPPELSFLTNTTDAVEEEDGFDFRASLIVFDRARRTNLKEDFCRDADACYIEAKRSIAKLGWIPSLKNGLFVLLRKRVNLFNPLPHMLLPLDFVWYAITQLRPSRWVIIWRASSVSNSESEEIELKEIGS